MGRIAEVIIRTWQTADKMKRSGAPCRVTAGATMRGPSATSPSTRSPAISHGMAADVGSIGRASSPTSSLEARVLSASSRAGAQGRLHRDGGHGRSQCVHSHAQPVRYRRCSPRRRRGALDLVHVPLEGGMDLEYPRGSGWGRWCAVGGCRTLGKASMIHNAIAAHRGRRRDYEVRADGQLLTCEPARCYDGPALLPLLSRMLKKDPAASSPSGESRPCS